MTGSTIFDGIEEDKYLMRICGDKEYVNFECITNCEECSIPAVKLIRKDKALARVRQHIDMLKLGISALEDEDGDVSKIDVFNMIDEVFGVSEGVKAEGGN